MEVELVQREPELMVYQEETSQLADQIRKQVEAMQPIKEKVEEEQPYVPVLVDLLISQLTKSQLVLGGGPI